MDIEKRIMTLTNPLLFYFIFHYNTHYYNFRNTTNQKWLKPSQAIIFHIAHYANHYTIPPIKTSDLAYSTMVDTAAIFQNGHLGDDCVEEEIKTTDKRWAMQYKRTPIERLPLVRRLAIATSKRAYDSMSHFGVLLFWMMPTMFSPDALVYRFFLSGIGCLRHVTIESVILRHCYTRTIRS